MTSPKEQSRNEETSKSAADETSTLQRPGAALARSPLHFFLVLDCSGSMNVNGRIQSLNTAIREMLPHLREVADEHPHAELLVSVLTFSTGIDWVVDEPTPVHDLRWIDVEAGGYTDMGAALSTLAARLDRLAGDGRQLPPAVVLVSDGEPTDNFERGLHDLNTTSLGPHAVRLAIAIGQEANRMVLSRFQDTGQTDAPKDPLEAHNPEQLAHAIRWASVAVGRQASEGDWEHGWAIVQPTEVEEGPMTW